MKRSFAITVDAVFTKNQCDGSGQELRDEMAAVESAVDAVLKTRVGRPLVGHVIVRVTHGESKDA